MALLASETRDVWTQFLAFAKSRCSEASFENWLAPIKMLSINEEEIILEVPNVFVKEYLLSNYKVDLCAFLPLKSSGEPSIRFEIAPPVKPVLGLKPLPVSNGIPQNNVHGKVEWQYEVRLNNQYRFRNYIEGPSNQFVKSAALGVASRPGNSYNPLFIHGGVGLGKTHILHSIGHYVKENHKAKKIQCITTEQFINEFVDNLRNKSIKQLKDFYREEIDLFLMDDIQFLQNRLNFEEELCNTIETLINQNKQIVITSDKPPGQLKLSERMVARLEWGLVVQVGPPDLETRVAILQHKAEQKGLKISNNILFFMAEHIVDNVRKLEGAINRLSAQCRLLNLPITQELVEATLGEMLHQVPQKRVSVEQILKTAATVFEIKVSDIKGAGRTKEVALARQVAMYLAKIYIKESLVMIAASFSKTHSTILHAYNTIEKKMLEDDLLRRKINMCRRNLDA